MRANKYNSGLNEDGPIFCWHGMTKFVFTHLFKRKSRAAVGRVTPDDIRRKLETYQKQEGPAVFGGAQLYCVEEVEPLESPIQPQ